MKRIAILTFGSRGDVQPYIALGLGLKAAGHSVRLVTHSEFEHFVRGYGLDFAPMQGDLKGLLGGDLGLQFMESGQNPLRLLLKFTDFAGRLIGSMLADAWPVCQDIDLIINSTIGWFIAHPIAEKLKIQRLSAYLQPVSPTRSFPDPSFPIRFNLGGWMNRLSYLFSGQMSWQMLRSAENQARRDVLELPPMHRKSPFLEMDREDFPLLYAFSPLVVPPPPDWGHWIHVTGYWHLDQASTWQPPQDLVDFIQAGPPPVYIGFGSMKERRPGETTEMVLKALEMSRQRAVLSAGWAGLGDRELPDTIYRVQDVPHDWLFPQMSAVVHHAGAGTTAASLRAGRPTITVPFFGDQPFWAKQVHTLGAGPRPILRNGLTARSLAEALRLAVNDKEMAQRAGELGRRLRIEDGVGCAVETLHTLIRAA